MYRKKNPSFFFISIILITLSFSQLRNNFNNPFINSDETIKIKEGMTKAYVLDQIGSPLFVKHGNLMTKTEIWVYEVRSVLVLSDIVKNQPRKSYELKKHSEDTHELQVIFIDGKVNSWGPYSMSENESNTSSKDNQDTSPTQQGVSEQNMETKSSSARKFSIGPRMGMVSAEVLNFDSGLAFGAHIGYGSYGLEFISYESDDSDYLISGMITKTISSGNYNIHTGLGFNSVEGLYDPYDDPEYDWAEGLFVRLGAGYPISFGSIAIEPMITLNIGLGDGNGWSGALINFQYGS